MPGGGSSVPDPGREPLLARAGRWFALDTPAAFRRAGACLAAEVAVTGALLFALGCVPQRVNSWDTAHLLDGGYRLLQGQRPHTDFYSPFGAAYLLLQAAGQELLGPCFYSMAVGQLLAYPFIAAWAWQLARARLPALPALLLASLAGQLVVGVRPLGYPFWDLSYAMLYNRLGWSLLLLIFVQLCIPPRAPLRPWQATREGALTGAAVVFLAFFKVNYFLVGGLFLLAGPLLYGLPRAAAAGVAAGAALPALALLAYQRFDVGAWWADQVLLARVQTLPDRLAAVAGVVLANAAALGVFGLAAYRLTRPAGVEAPAAGPAGRWRALAAALGLIGLGILVCSANAQLSDLPVGAVAVLALAEAFRRRQAAAGVPGPEAWAAAGWGAVAAGVLAAAILVPDALGLLDALALTSGTEAPRGVVDAAPLGDLALPREAGESADVAVTADRILARPPEEDLTSWQYAVLLNDGLALARRHITPESRLLVLDEFNPLSFALQLPCPRGDALFWHYGRVVDERHHPPLARVFRDVTVVMAPRRGVYPESTAFVQRLAAPVLEAEFEPVEQTRLWTLYVHRPAERSETIPLGAMPTALRGHGALANFPCPRKAVGMAPRSGAPAGRRARAITTP